MDARLNDAAIHRKYSNSQRRAVLFSPLHFRLQATAPRFVVPTLVGGCLSTFNFPQSIFCGPGTPLHIAGRQPISFFDKLQIENQSRLLYKLIAGVIDDRSSISLRAPAKSLEVGILFNGQLERLAVCCLSGSRITASRIGTDAHFGHLWVFGLEHIGFDLGLIPGARVRRVSTSDTEQACQQ